MPRGPLTAAPGAHCVTSEVLPQPAGSSSRVSRYAVGRRRARRAGRGTRPRVAGGCSFVGSSTRSAAATVTRLRVPQPAAQVSTRLAQ